MSEFDHIRPASVCPLCGEIIRRTVSIIPVKGDLTVNGLHQLVGRSKEAVVEVTWMCDAGCSIKVLGTMPVDKTRFKKARPEPKKAEPLKVNKEILERARRTMDALEIDDEQAAVEDIDDSKWSKPIFG